MRAAKLIFSDFRELCLDAYGCRVLQTLIEVLGTGSEMVKQLFAKISDCLVYMSLNCQGNHVIQKFIEILGD